MSIATALVCTRCDRSYCPPGDERALRGPRGDRPISPTWNAGPERYTANVLRGLAKSDGWRVAVQGIAPKLRRTQGAEDFCPECVEAWEREESGGQP